MYLNSAPAPYLCQIVFVTLMYKLSGVLFVLSESYLLCLPKFDHCYLRIKDLVYPPSLAPKAMTFVCLHFILYFLFYFYSFIYCLCSRILYIVRICVQADIIMCSASAGANPHGQQASDRITSSTGHQSSHWNPGPSTDWRSEDTTERVVFVIPSS